MAAPRDPVDRRRSVVYLEPGPRAAFEANEDRRKHYTASPYYPLWTVIVDRLRRPRSRAVLEVACGSGQLAAAGSHGTPPEIVGA